ncbi:MAG: citrate lyase subunit alpha, partial [Ignavibacteriales bacterium]|nr:citrate lyase subunit alpha [Ignavibacteriales bacterium]
MKMIKNKAGRLVPNVINNQKQIPFKGVDKFKSSGRIANPPIRTCAEYPGDGNKEVKSLKDALKKA